MRNGVLAGFLINDREFGNRGDYAIFWSSSNTETSAWRRYLSSRGASECKNTFDKSLGFSAIYKAKGGRV